MVLVNGAEGIGTGWSTFIPNYSPREIAANIKRLLDGEALEPMQPWYRGFRWAMQACCFAKRVPVALSSLHVIQLNSCPFLPFCKHSHLVCIADSNI
jgi:hypothetical protein